MVAKTKKPPKKPSAKLAPTPAEKIEAVGIDAICERIRNNDSITTVAKSIGVDQGSLRYWIAQDVSRSARAREARALTAAACDDDALQLIADAADPFELSKAREAAQHLRWRASKIAPKEYGDKLQVGGAEDLPPIQSVTTMTPDEAYRRLLEGGK